MDEAITIISELWFMLKLEMAVVRFPNAFSGFGLVGNSTDVA
jgi:hypothetical protein